MYFEDRVSNYLKRTKDLCMTVFTIINSSRCVELNNITECVQLVLANLYYNGALGTWKDVLRIYIGHGRTGRGVQGVYVFVTITFINPCGHICLSENYLQSNT